MRALLPTEDAERPVAIGEVPAPTPAHNEALVAVEAFSINRGETFLLECPRNGWRPGKDVAGRVVGAAADGTGPIAGERVVGHPPAAGWAEVAAVPTAALCVVPPGVGTFAAAALPLAGLTALRLLRAAGPLAGASVLLTGASGGVGHYVTELASGIGARVTAVSASPHRAARLAELGAAEVVHELAGANGPFDVVLESVGGDSFARAFSLLRKRGRLIWFGQASREPVTLDFFEHFERTGATIRHFHYEDSDRSVAEDLGTLVRLVASGRLHPEIGLLADWTESAGALVALRERRVRGNAVLRIPQPSQQPKGTTHD